MLTDKGLQITTILCAKIFVKWQNLLVKLCLILWYEVKGSKILSNNVGDPLPLFLYYYVFLAKSLDKNAEL